MPQIRAYPQAISLQSTDAFVIDRVSQGTMFIEGLNLPNTQFCLTFIIDGGGSVPVTGVWGFLYIPFACTITSATLLADQTGSAVVDIWKTLFLAFPSTDANTIVASTPPTITTARTYQDTVLTGWTTQINASDTLTFNLDSVSAITKLTVALAITKTT